MRAGLLGAVTKEDDTHVATRPTTDGLEVREEHRTAAQAVACVARNAADGRRFHDLRHSYASWLIASGVPVPDVQRVMGHERPTTTLGIYTHVQNGLENRVLTALTAFSPHSQNDDDH